MSSNTNTTISIKDYFDKGRFVIPNYQRGYKWAVKENNQESSLEIFLNDLINAFQQKKKTYFIEAVTVVEDKNDIILVDGQQRTTSLFLLFVGFKSYDFIRGKLKYDIREDSHIFLNNLLSDNKKQIDDEDTQDIFYFNKALKLIKEKLRPINKKEFSEFIKNKVRLLYNVVPKNKATNIFIALNGLKAVMKEEELIKSDLLIKSSRSIGNVVNYSISEGLEWKIKEDRGRLARNWDKWLYWWNKEDVKTFFGISKGQYPLYYLLNTYLRLHRKSTKFSFSAFKENFLNSSKNAKLTFNELRKLQKSFEDLFNNYETHNLLGFILITISSNKLTTLEYFLDTKITDKIDLFEYAKWALVGATHSEIISKTTEKESDKDIEIRSRKARDVIALLNEKYVYEYEKEEGEKDDGRKEFAFKTLLFFNLLKDNELERKFDFSIWNNRSLEHIHPQSKKGDLKFDEDSEGSIHCIGNLVLLYKNDNSSFQDKSFDDKKVVYFSKKDFKSRHLLHTISVFANSEWTEKEIIKNKKKVISKLKKYYGL